MVPIQLQLEMLPEISTQSIIESSRMNTNPNSSLHPNPMKLRNEGNLFLFITFSVVYDLEMPSQLIITFPEDIDTMHDYINKVISFVPTQYRKSIKNIRKLIDKLLTTTAGNVNAMNANEHTNFVQLTFEQLSEIESNLFLIRDRITERVYEVKNKFKNRIEESSEFVQLMKLLKYRFTYVIFNNCVLMNETQLNEIREKSEEDYFAIINDNKKCYELMKPFAVVNEYYCQ
jgi:hypothetical protein